ncbi:site-specific integrase [Domibacillus sp. PGB-M46]|uniref:site-specific integrase n=1 Tax=Domibacillus sp. PGB-M46 TaxID=2910255 RepID=UPI0021049670
MTADELKVFIAGAKQLKNRTHYTMILLLAYTGLRIGESLGLTWNDIDFEKKTISINKTRDKHGIRTPKTKQSYRTILVGDFLLQQLAAYRTWCMEMKFRYGSRLKSEDLIFISHLNGEPCIDCVLQHCFKKLCEKTGLERETHYAIRFASYTGNSFDQPADSC